MSHKMAIGHGGAEVEPSACRWRTASSGRQSEGRTRTLGMPPTGPASNVTFSRGETLPITASNGPRASIPRSTPLLDRVSARMASIIFASCESSGCIAMELLDGSSTGVSFTIRSPFGWNEMRLSRPQSGPRRSATHPPSLTCLRRREFDHEIVVHRYEWPIAASGVAFRSHHARSFHPAGMCLAVIDRNEFAGSLPRSFNDHVGRLASDNVRDRVGWATGDIGNH
jgi:hypothetical protein